jgi:hypothetical protein
LSGKFLTSAASDGTYERGNLRDLFCENGTWFRFGGSEITRGVYTVENDTVCQRSENGDYEICRRFYRDPGGRLGTQWLEAGNPISAPGYVATFPADSGAPCNGEG